MAWQFHRPEAGEGMVQVFRRDHSPYESARFKLHWLETAASYTFSDADGKELLKITGQELMAKGLPVTITEQPAVANFLYRKIMPKVLGHTSQSCEARSW